MRFVKFVLICACLLFLWFGQTAQAAFSLSGRIVLQVQDKGQAWYIFPPNNQRYFLKNKDEAFQKLIQLGVGISNRDFANLSNKIPSKLLGRVLIKVEDRGQAFYLDPENKTLFSLKNSDDVLKLIKTRGLGIKNADLEKIEIEKNLLKNSEIKNLKPKQTASSDVKELTYNWKYQNKDYYLQESLSNNLYQEYLSLPRQLVYPENKPPLNPRDSFYQMIIKTKENDRAFDGLLNHLVTLGKNEGYQNDELIEFVMAFVQYLPYDQNKANETKIQANYPYETLYKKAGICSDKSFLAALFLRRLGYGSIILDFPEANHSAVGIQCPVNDSTKNSGYCFIETTNYLPIGLIPQSINAGVAGSSKIDQAFNPSHLGKIEYYQKNSGKTYNGVTKTKTKISSIQSLEIKIEQEKKELTTIQEKLSKAEEKMKNLKKQLEEYQIANNLQNYNNLVPVYNTAVKQYNDELTAYQAKIDASNITINKYNEEQKNLFQK